MTAPAGGSMPTYLGMPAFPVAARTAVANSQLRANLTHATRTIRAKRAAAVAELHDQLGQVGLPRGDPAGGQRLVEPDLLGGHRLDLDHLVGAV